MERLTGESASSAGAAGLVEVVVVPTPAQLGRYRLLGVLGQGGMAMVHLAEHATLGKRVAIKTLLPRYAGSKAAREIFMREARIASSIRHPNLVDVYDLSVDPHGRPYFVMELVAGETLAQRIERGPLLLPQCLDVAIQIADAVAAVHAAGFLHRDIKSENVLLIASGRRLEPKLADFGIARELAAGLDESPRGIVGTPRTMAPEQIAQERVDERTDVWALGVLLFEMITARLPFPAGNTIREDLVAIVTEPPAALLPSVPEDLRAIVGACLAKDPEDRPPSAAALVELLSDARAAYLAHHDMIERALVANEAWKIVAELEAESKAAELPAPTAAALAAG